MDVSGASHLKAVLAGLERDHRYIVLMYYADDLDVEEIGLVLDLPSYRVQGVLETFGAEVARRVETLGA